MRYHYKIFNIRESEDIVEDTNNGTFRGWDHIYEAANASDIIRSQYSIQYMSRVYPIPETDEDHVILKYPDAYPKYEGIEYRIETPMLKRRISDFCKTPEEAWKSAKHWIDRKETKVL